MTSMARIERAALCDLLLEVGPDHPTLCEGWSTRDLAAHLVVRERRPDAALGILAPPFARHGDSVRRSVAEQPWEQLVHTVRSGPPAWSPMRIGRLDAAVNTVEFFVHHEDVRRAVDNWEPRPADPALDEALWAILAKLGKLLARRAPCGVVAAPPDREPVTLRDATPSVTIRSRPGEILFFLEGRQAHAHVEMDGPAEAVDSLRNARLGI